MSSPAPAPEVVNYSVVSGKKYFFFSSIILIIVGVGSLISGAIVLGVSNNYFIGSVYTGGLAIIAGCMGLFLPNKCYYGFFMTFVVLAFLASIAGVISDSIVFAEVGAMEACAINTSSGESCGVGTSDSYTCYGDSDAYMSAYFCELSWLNDNGNAADFCICVKSATSDTCYKFPGMGDCGAILTTIPQSLQASVAFDIVCFITTFFMLILSCMGCCCPTGIESQEEREQKYSQPGSTELVQVEVK
jgi:hypothetical protein